MKLTKAATTISNNTNTIEVPDSTTINNDNHNPLPTTEEKNNGKGPVITSLRIIYSLKETNTKFNIGTNHKKLLEEMMKMDSTIHIIPNDEETPPYNNLTEFPHTELSFKRQFKVIEANNRITVCHDIQSTKTFAEMKSYVDERDQKIDTELLLYMKQHNIVGKTDLFYRKRMASVGIMICINPDIIHRDTLRKELSEALDDIDLYEADYNHFYYDMSDPLKEPPRQEIEEETLRLAPEFEVGYGTLSYKDETAGNISIKVLDIQCATRDAQLLKEMFSEIDFKEYFKEALFIPRGLVKLNKDPLAYKQYVDCHINYMVNTTQFAIIGLKTKTLDFEIETEFGNYSPKQILFESQFIEAIHTTPNTNKKGIWMIVTTKTNLEAATQFFDSEIEKIFEFIPNNPEYIDERNIIPTRLAKQRRLQSMKTITRSTILSEQIPQTITVRPDGLGKKQNNKRQIQYDDHTSSKHPKTNGNGKQTPSDNTEITTSTKISDMQALEKKFEGRIAQLETRIDNYTKKLNTDEANREKNDRKTKKRCLN
jgi:hypothetical protein